GQIYAAAAEPHPVHRDSPRCDAIAEPRRFHELLRPAVDDERARVFRRSGGAVDDSAANFSTGQFIREYEANRTCPRDQDLCIHSRTPKFTGCVLTTHAVYIKNGEDVKPERPHQAGDHRGRRQALDGAWPAWSGAG